MRLSTVAVPMDTPTPAPTEWADTWFLGPDVELWGSGVASRIDLPAPWPDHIGGVVDRLRELRLGRHSALGVGPVAFGALPFDRRAPASLVVCATTLTTHRDGRRWRTAVDPNRPPDSRDVPAPPPPDAVVTPVTDAARWADSVRRATERIAAGAMDKVVLARALDVTAEVEWDAPTVAARLAAAHPHALRWCVGTSVGASPELLVARHDDVVRAQPMAGTTPRSGDDTEADRRLAAELLASEKNRAEHQITIDMVHDALLGWCSYLDSEPEPRVVPAGSVQHLASMVEGRLSSPRPSVLELVAALHPTPAVGGWPVGPALTAIDDLEDVSRGRYAGPVGWIDAEGNGTWAVGIRGAELDGTVARVFAGVGVVAESDPEIELQETRDKLAATLPLLTDRHEPASA